MGIVIGGNEDVEGDITGREGAGGNDIDWFIIEPLIEDTFPDIGDPSELVITPDVSICIPNFDSISLTDSIKSGKFHNNHLDQNPAVSVPFLVQFSRDA